MNHLAMLLDWLKCDDFVSAIFTISLLGFTARMVSNDRPATLRWSQRLTAAAMIGHGTLLWMSEPPESVAETSGILFRSLLTGALALFVSQISITVLTCLHSFTLHPLQVAAQRQREENRRREEHRRRELETEARRQAAQLEWERQAPAREEARRAAEEQARQAQSDRHRREQSRLECELFYALHAADIAARFSQGDFDQFVAKYLHDRVTAEEAEARAQQLHAIIRQHAEKIQPPPKFSSLTELTAWYDRQQAEAVAIGDERLRRYALAQLRARYTDLTRQLVEEDDR